MSTRIRPPERDLDRKERRRGRRPPGRPPRPPRRARMVALPLAGAAVLIALIVGWAAGSAGGGRTATVTETRTVTAPAGGRGAAASGPASRAAIALAVLNGSEEEGLAGRTAERARSLGYRRVTEGNAPAPAATDRVYSLRGATAQALQVADDLGLPEPQPMPPADPVAASVDPATQVVVVLGPRAGGPAAAGDAVTREPVGVTPPDDDLAPAG